MKSYLKNYSVALSYFERRPAMLPYIFGVICLFISNWAQLLIEVFIRKKFGIRYFYFAGAFRVFLIFTLFPLIPLWVKNYFRIKVSAQVQEQLDNMPDMARGFMEDKIPEEISTGPSFADYLPGWEWLTWYLFFAAFLYVSFLHRREQRSRPHILDKPTYTRYRGKIHPAFYRLQFPWFKTTTQIIECFLEPAPFFVGGFFLYMIGQHLGLLLMICSVSYCGAYLVGYMVGDIMVMNTIDNDIMRRNLEKALMKDDLHQNDAEDTEGFEYRTRIPSGEQFRKKLLEKIQAEDDAELVAR